MLKKRVKIQSMNFTKTKQTPVTYIATATMAVGQPKLTTTESDNPTQNTGQN